MRVNYRKIVGKGGKAGQKGKSTGGKPVGKTGKKGIDKKRVAGALSKAASDDAERSAAAAADTSHEDASLSNENYRARHQASTPGKAQAIIKKKRV